MKRIFLIAVGAIALMATMAGTQARADGVTGNLDIGTAGPGPGFSVFSSSQGSVDFTLAQNGTIDATVDLVDGQNISSFFYDSSTSLSESSFSSTGYTESSPTNFYGLLNSGVDCSYSCTSTLSFVIGSPGEFTSVYQAIDGGQTTYPFFVDAEGGYFLASAVSVSAAPEPSTWALLMLGIGGIGFIFRKAQKDHGFTFRRALAG